MFCRTVTRLRARREAVPVVTPAATAPEATDPEVVVLMAQATEVAAEEPAATPDPAAAKEEAPLVPGGDSSEDFASHMSVFNFLSFSCLLSGARQRSRWE